MPPKYWFCPLFGLLQIWFFFFEDLSEAFWHPAHGFLLLFHQQLKSTAPPLRSKRIYPRMKVIPSLFVGRSVGSRWLAASVIALLAIFFGSVTGAANDLFSSNVVTLTSSNWKEHVVDNPHMVLVNICRKGWGYCQLLQPWVITLCHSRFPSMIFSVISIFLITFSPFPILDTHFCSFILVSVCLENGRSWRHPLRAWWPLPIGILK